MLNSSEMSREGSSGSSPSDERRTAGRARLDQRALLAQSRGQGEPEQVGERSLVAGRRRQLLRDGRVRRVLELAGGALRARGPGDHERRGGVLHGRLAQDDGRVEQGGVAVVADEPLHAQGADAGSVRGDEDEGLVMRGAREAVGDLEHRRGRRGAGQRAAPLGDVPRRDQRDLAVRVPRKGRDQVAQVDVASVEGAVELLLRDRRSVDSRELRLDLLRHRVVGGRAWCRIGGGLRELLREGRRARRVEGVGRNTAGERGRHALEGEHRYHGRDRDGEQRESVEAQIDHWLAF